MKIRRTDQATVFQVLGSITISMPGIFTISDRKEVKVVHARALRIHRDVFQCHKSDLNMRENGTRVDSICC